MENESSLRMIAGLIKSFKMKDDRELIIGSQHESIQWFKQFSRGETEAKWVIVYNEEVPEPTIFNRVVDTVGTALHEVFNGVRWNLNQKEDFQRDYESYGNNWKRFRIEEEGQEGIYKDKEAVRSFSRRPAGVAAMEAVRYDKSQTTLNGSIAGLGDIIKINKRIAFTVCEVVEKKLRTN